MGLNLQSVIGAFCFNCSNCLSLELEKRFYESFNKKKELNIFEKKMLPCFFIPI